MTDYDRSYFDFLAKVDHDLDLTDTDHRQALITWLNQWGCRQFSRECHELASNEIFQWYLDCKDMLPEKDTDLHLMSSHEIELVSKAFAKLAGKTACHKTRGSKTVSVTIGPTGAAKILFALRPNSLVPWDEPIRAELKLDASGRSYSRFLSDIKGKLCELESQCKTQGFSLHDLPTQLNRPDSTTPKLIDEFYWVTFTKKCQFPGNATMSKWLTWNKGI